MEFFVVDPKETAFIEWAEKVREFLKLEGLEYTEADGELYYLGDDIAVPWDENSILFTIDGEDGGVIELRDTDRSFYVFADDLDIFDEREVEEATGYQGRISGALYGFQWNNQSGCRFHLGPTTGVYFFCEGDEADYPPRLELADSWALFFRAAHWVGNSVSRIQDLKELSADKVVMDFEVKVSFKHPASLDALNELLVDEDGYERTRTELRATFRDRDLGWVRNFVSLLPTDDEDFEDALFRAVWRGTTDKGDIEVFYLGIERRNLRPFVQLPVQRTSKSLLDRFRNFFKGHRIDRQEYYL